MLGWDDPTGMATGAERLFELLSTASVKSAAMLAAGAVAALALRRGSAAARHLAWSVAVAGALSVPALSAVLPAWRIAPAIGRHTPSRDREGAVVAPRLSGPLADARGSAGAARPGDVASTDPVPIERPAGRPSRPALPSYRIPVQRDPRHADASSIAHRFSSAWTPSGILGVWLAGAIISAIPVWLGILSLRRVARGSVPVTDPAMLELARRLAAQVGVRRPVRLIISPARPVPMTWGLRRPIILLPADAAGWTEERLTMALLHELAHVKRWDSLTQLVARAACAAYWFNPLAWLAMARIRREQEQAADDLALDSGLDRHAYAGHLLAIVAGRDVIGSRTLVATAMAASSKLERRLRDILDGRRTRRGPGRRATMLVVAASAVLLPPLAALEPRGEARVVPAVAPSNPWQQPAGGGAALAGAGAISVDSELLAKVREMSFKPPDESMLRRGAVQGLLEVLHDPHSTYIDAKQMADLTRSTTGKLTGIGAQLGMSDGRVTVLTPLPDSPAAKAGLRAGDVIEAINGRPTEGIDAVEAVRRIVGKEGEVVRLQVKHADGRTAELAITRGVVQIRSVRGFRAAGDREDFLLDPDRATGYIAIQTFAQDTPGALRAAIDDLKARKVKGLILDLRGCPGGFLDAAIDSARLFLSKGTIVTIRKRDRADRPIAADGPDAAPGADLSLIVLVDGSTASAAEIFTGALKENHRAIVVGSRTVGKGSIQSIVPLKDGGAVRLTTAYYLLPYGRDIDRHEGKADWGVDPTDGFYVPLDGLALEAMLRRRSERGRIVEPAPAAAKVTPESIEHDEFDAPLAAALRAMSAWSNHGQVVGTGFPLSEQASRLKGLDEARSRRRALLDDLKKVEKQIGELEPGTAGRP
jgi:carboxyl-terminal processing protease